MATYSLPTNVRIVGGHTDDPALIVASAGTSLMPSVARLTAALGAIDEAAGSDMLTLFYDARSEIVALTEYATARDTIGTDDDPVRVLPAIVAATIRGMAQ